MAANPPVALRAVASDERPERPKGVVEAASKGTHRELLVAMRDRIAEAVANPGCPPRDLAALTRRLHELAKEIEVIDLTNEPKGANRGAVADLADDEEFDASAI